MERIVTRIFVLAAIGIALMVTPADAQSGPGSPGGAPISPGCTPDPGCLSACMNQFILDIDTCMNKYFSDQKNANKDYELCIVADVYADSVCEQLYQRALERTERRKVKCENKAIEDRDNCEELCECE